MSKFTIHNMETAPQESKEILSGAEKKLTFIPNLYAIMAESPTTLKAYTGLSDNFDESSFNATEKQIILLATSFVNSCHYCMAVHSTLAQMFKVPENIVYSLRNNKPISDAKLEALRQFTLAVVEKKGWATKEDIQKFLSSGYTKAQILEVIVGVTQKTLSNYVSHIVQTPLDAAFEQNKWESSGK